MVAVAIAVANWNVSAPTLVHVTRPVADAASVQRSYAWIDHIANAIGIHVCLAATATNAEGVQLVAVAIAIARWDAFTTALQNRPRTVAHAARIHAADAQVDVVANAIAICIGGACATTIADGIQLVAIAIAIASRNVVASAIATWAISIAYATSIHNPDAFVDIVTNAIVVQINLASPSADANCIQFVAVAIAIACRDFPTTTCINLAGTIANATSIVLPHAWIEGITNPVVVKVCFASSSTHPNGVLLIPEAITRSNFNVRTSAFINLTWTVANTAIIVLAHAIVHVVTDAVGIVVFDAVAATYAQGIFLVAIAIAVVFGNVGASALIDVSRSVTYATNVIFQTASVVVLRTLVVVACIFVGATADVVGGVSIASFLQGNGVDTCRPAQVAANLNLEGG